MAGSRALNTGVGVISLGIFICGILFFIFLNHVLTQLLNFTFFGNHLWSLISLAGVLFLLHGTVGILTSIGQTEACYTANMAVGICIFTLKSGCLIGILASITFLAAVMPGDTCYDEDGQCTCVGTKNKIPATCDYVRSVWTMYIIVCVVTVLGLVLSATSSIISAVLRRRCPPLPPSVHYLDALPAWKYDPHGNHFGEK